MSSGIGSAGNAAAVQLMQASNNLRGMTATQITAVNDSLESTKASALQNTAKQVSSSVERKSNAIDLMA